MKQLLEEVVGTRLTRVERRLLEAAAAREGISLAAAVRRFIVTGLEGQFGPGALEHPAAEGAAE